MRYLKPSIFPLFTAIFIFSFFSIEPSYAKDESLPIEGISYETKDPSKSFAIIDGAFYEKGAQYQDYEIVEVLQDRVVTKNKSGTIAQHRITGGKALSDYLKDDSQKSPPTFSGTQEEVPASPSGNEDPKTLLLEQVKKMFGNLNPAEIMNYVLEISVKADLRNLYTQVNVAMMESDGQIDSLDKMIADEKINPAYKEGKNGYQYRVENGSKGVQVFASPIKGTERSIHFMIDAWGNMRVEQGKPATVKSPLVKIPDAFKGLVPQPPQSQMPPDGYDEQYS